MLHVREAAPALGVSQQRQGRPPTARGALARLGTAALWAPEQSYRRLAPAVQPWSPSLRGAAQDLTPPHLAHQATRDATLLPLFDDSNSALLPLFDPALSPRNTALVACVDGGTAPRSGQGMAWAFGGVARRA